VPLYHLDDEPLPGPLSRLAVSPMWPLLAVMLGGCWLSWPWFAFNGWAVGSPTRRRETALVVAGFIGSVLLVATILLMDRRGLFSPISARFALLTVLIWKLLVSYSLYITQSRSFELYRYYGGPARNGLLVVVLGFFLDPRLSGAVKGLWLRLVLS
jgi:hypothetical protein